MKHRMRKTETNERALLHLIGQTWESTSEGKMTTVLDVCAWSGLSKPTVIKWLDEMTNKMLLEKVVTIHRKFSNGSVALKYQYKPRITTLRKYRIGEYKTEYWMLLSDRVKSERNE